MRLEDERTAETADEKKIADNLPDLCANLGFLLLKLLVNRPTTRVLRVSKAAHLLRLEFRSLMWLGSRINQILLKGIGQDLKPFDGILTCLVLLVPSLTQLANFPRLQTQLAPSKPNSSDNLHGHSINHSMIMWLIGKLLLNLLSFQKTETWPILLTGLGYGPFKRS